MIELLVILEDNASFGRTFWKSSCTLPFTATQLLKLNSWKMKCPFGAKVQFSVALLLVSWSASVYSRYSLFTHCHLSFLYAGAGLKIGGSCCPPCHFLTPSPLGQQKPDRRLWDTPVGGGGGKRVFLGDKEWCFFCYFGGCLHSPNLTARPWKLMLGRWISFWDGPISGAFAVSFGEGKGERDQQNIFLCFCLVSFSHLGKSAGELHGWDMKSGFIFFSLEAFS